MVVSVRKAKDTTVVELEGNLILGEPVDVFRARVQELLGTGTKQLAISLAQLKYLDSSGVGGIVAVLTSAKSAGVTCRFFGASRPVMAILKMLGIDRAIDLYPDESAALSSPTSLNLAA